MSALAEMSEKLAESLTTTRAAAYAEAMKPSAALLAERAATHGDADVTAITYTRLSRAIGDMPTDELTSRIAYPLDMILVKLARIACGDATHEDHWADIAGYALMAQNMVKK